MIKPIGPARTCLTGACLCGPDPHPALAEQGFRAVRIGGLEADQPPRSLLLHGFTGLAEDWCACWPCTEPALAIDLPGHGGSIAPEGAFDDALRRLLVALPDSIDRIVGYSLGGRLALGLLRLVPERFDQAMILSAHPGLIEPDERESRRLADQRWISLLEQKGLEAFVDAWQQLPLFATQTRLPVECLAQQRERRLSQHASALAASLRVHGLAEMPPMQEAIVDYPGELHWVAGSQDRRFSALAREVAAWRLATRLHLLPGVGHNLLLEAPEQLQALPLRRSPF
ncbi:alpha/beta fold hydrolase [Lamprobacter modestohalophilus]|uniref:alpha/beta fold hydrolase n=1 Tax=Lamprobacter modestohalophilus TaxID=1064514 RepID=UPI002ADEBB26|nr:alpha/beta fold hydrolase [Lamprobacter modestohalophilus]MEA1049274.1 alpha/beta fold hydrolase [Lamprobacter modestohalophilus]